MIGTPFEPVQAGGRLGHNAVQIEPEDDLVLGMGFVSAADAVVEHWQEHGPNDLHLIPIILNYRHGLELLLKAAIRLAARCLRQDGEMDREIKRDAINRWLSTRAGHSLETLANRLNGYLGRLDLEALPNETHQVLMSLHTLDPRGDTFRYATTWDRHRQRYVSTHRPPSTHIDVVEMGARFRDAASLISGGLITQLDEYAQLQAKYR